MFAVNELKALQQQKRSILALSDLQRRLLRLEWNELQSRAGWIDDGISTVRMLLPALRCLAPCLKGRPGSKASGASSWRQKIGSAIDFAGHFAQMWRVFSQPQGDRPPQTPAAEP